MKTSRIYFAIVVVVVLLATGVFAGTKWVKFDGTMTAQSPQVLIERNTASSFAFRLHIPSYQVGDVEAEGETWQRIVFKGAAEHATPGEPNLPVFSRWIAIPDGATPRVRVTAGGQQLLKSVNCIPAQRPAAECNDDQVEPFDFGGPVYDENADFPGTLYRVEGPSVIRGLRMMQLLIYPVQWNPATETATLYADIQVRVDFAGSKGTFFSNRRARSFQKIYDLAMNHTVFAGEPMPAPRGKSANGAEYVILSAPGLVDQAADLAEWKTLQGYDTEVYTTDDSGTTCDAVKAWVQNAYDTWDPAPEFLLLFGDAEFINPCYVIYDYGEYVGSDRHFVQVDGGDEWADIAVARISVDTAQEAQNRVDAIIAYERTPIVNESYYTNAYVAAYFQPASSGYAERRFCRTSEEMVQWFNVVMDDSPFTAHRIYVTDSYYSPLYWNQSTYNWTPTWWGETGLDSLNIPSELLRSNGFAWNGGATDISAAVNGGTAFITHRDHGAETGWSDPAFNLTQAQALTNGEKMPVLWSINCLTGYFDNETAGASHAECFTEGWERNPNGGAVGIIGSTRVSYSGRNDRMYWGWLDSMWPDYVPEWPAEKNNDPEWRMGLVLEYGKLYMNDFYVGDPYREVAITEFHWFGDPTLEMWAGVPGEMTVTHLPILPMGATGFDVEVDVNGALVALTQDGLLLGKAISAAGSAHIDFAAPITTVEDAHLVVTRHQYRPYEADVMVGATADGVVSLNRTVYTENDTIEVSVSDADLTGEGTYTLTIDSDREPAGESVVCTELEIGGDGTGTFFGSLAVTTAAPAEANGVLSIANGDTITAYYHDEDTGSGNPADKTDTAYADTAAPTFGGVTGAVGGDQKVTLTWTAATDLTPPITYQIYRADDSGGQNFDVPLTTATTTTYEDRNLPNMETYYYVVRATDALGHQDTNTNEAYALTVGPVLIWEEDFDDNKSGIPDTWEIVDGGYTGLNGTWSDTNPGQRSNSNWSGVFAIADSDETGSGNVWDDDLITEPIDCTGFSDVRLVFSHFFNWISGYGDDRAVIDISNDGGSTWTNVVNWTGADRSGIEDLDISEWADNQANVKIRFTYTGNYDYYWGIDNLELIGQVAAEPPAIGDFTADVTSGAAPLEVSFSASTSGLVGTYDWDFGDGGSSASSNPTHTYEAVGTYSVSLAVTGPYGDDSMTKTDYIVVGCPTPAVDFEADVTSGAAPLAVQFSDLTDVLTGCLPTAVGWTFGDGGTSDQAEPAHTYTDAGTYTVSLTYTTDYGDGAFTETKTDYITVSGDDDDDDDDDTIGDDDDDDTTDDDDDTADDDTTDDDTSEADDDDDDDDATPDDDGDDDDDNDDDSGCGC